VMACKIVKTQALACKRCKAPPSYAVTFNDHPGRRDYDLEFCDDCLPKGALEKIPGWKEATQ
jgi:hypothetical protein